MTSLRPGTLSASVKVRPASSGGAHGLKVTGKHDLEIGRLEFAGVAGRRGGAPADRAITAGEREEEARSGALNAGDRCERCLQLALEGGALFGLLAGPAAQELEGQQMMGVEAGLDALQREEAAEHEAAADQQDEAEGHFRDHHSVAQPAGAAESGIAAAAAQHLGDIGACGAPGRDGAEDGGGGERGKQGEHDSGGIDRDGIEARQVGGGERAQLTDGEGGQRDSRGAAGDGEYQRLRQHLGQEPPPVAAERGPHREFALAQRGAHQQQVGHVRAGDEEQEDHRAHQGDQGRAHGFDHVPVHGFDADGEARRVLDAVDAAHGGGVAIGGGLGARQSGAGAQPRDRAPGDVVAIGVVVRDARGEPKIGHTLHVGVGGKEQFEAGREHADHDVVALCEAGQGLAEHVGAAAETALPVVMAKDHHAGQAGGLRGGRRVRVAVAPAAPRRPP